MAGFDRFLIAPLNTGLETDLKSWLIPDDAFAELQNAYVFRGRVRKRFGSRFMGTGWSSPQTEPLFSRLRIDLGNTDGSGDASGTVPGNIFKLGQMFSVGTTIFTVNNGTAGIQNMLSTGTATGTYDVSDGAYAITGAAASTPIWFYPSEPVMGLDNYQLGSIDNQPSYAFDTQFAYLFAGGFWQRSVLGIPPVWHGNDLNFFWVNNWDGITANVVTMFVSNFQAFIGTALVTDDPIWAFDSTSGWQPFSYSPDATINTLNQQPYTVTQTITNGTIISNYVQTARIVVSFKNRLLLLNTVENNANGATQYNTGSDILKQTTGITPTSYLTSTNTKFVNRCRYSINGSPFAANAWLEPNLTYQPSSGGTTYTSSGAGFIDATTEEAIVSAEFIKDRLIVYFERSTWELAYTGNEVLPFVWQKINTELGSEAQQSTVPFDKQILTIGNTGVHACNGANVQRIDNKIPDEIFTISNKNLGVQRVAGIRDYYVEMVYWSFPSSSENSSNKYPDRVLVYNYQNGAWAFNNDCITSFGYFEQQQGITWASTTNDWSDCDFAWASGTTQAQFRQVIAGNQQGYVFIIDAEQPRNERAMQITNLTYPSTGTVQLVLINHTLEVGEYISIENPQGINLPIIGIYEVIAIIDANTVNIWAPDVSGTYLGGGNSARVSNIQILSKQWNPYVNKDRNVFLQRIDFGVTKTQNGQITVDYYPSATEMSLIDEGGPSGTNSMLGNNILETSPYALAPLEQMQERLWHPVYFQSDGTCIQIYIYLNDAQISSSAIAWSFFEIQGMILYVQPTTTRLN